MRECSPKSPAVTAALGVISKTRHPSLSTFPNEPPGNTAGPLVSSTSQIYNLGAASRSPVVAQAIGSAGWVPMVTGQSLVLYSRLHLLRVDTRLLRLLLGLIVFNAVSIHVPTIVVGVLASLPRSGRYAGPYDTVEKIEITMFFVQEVSLSGVYLWQARHFQRKYGRRLHGGGGGGGCVGEGVGGMLRDLVAVNAVVVALDVSVLALQFMNLFFVQIVAKNFIYSLKLKLELGVLNQLREFVRRTRDLDPHYVERERRWELGKVQIQWEAALRRAFGSIGRTRSTRDGEPETHVAEGQQVMTPALLKSTTREVLISGGQPGPGEVQAPEKNLGIANNTEQP